MEVLYICDRKACGKKCGDYCRHTSNIQHAANFKESEFMPGIMVEVGEEQKAAEFQRKSEIVYAPMDRGTGNGAFWFALSVILWAITVAVTVATQLL